MEEIRAFIAIELPEELKQKLSQLESRFKARGQLPVRWVDPNSIHLTLQFLGNIAGDSVSEITEAMEEAAQGISPFSLEMKNTGVFPDQKRARVAWVGLTGDVDKLLQLQGRLETSLKPLGFAPETRAFTPHLTLARVNERASPEERQRFGQLIAETSFEGGDLTVDAISLMRSQLTRAGAIYSRLSLVRLEE